MTDIGRGGSSDGPVAIGGVGGSGTRVVADLVRMMGVFIGDHLNASNDNLEFPGLDRFRPGRAPTRPELTDAELDQFVDTMVAGFRRQQPAVHTWGWKNPPNFLFLEAFARRLPDLRYVHVIRHGLDMAFSRNHNQVRQWGHLFDVEYGVPSPELSALRYWIDANDWAVATAGSVLDGRFTLVSFDDLCTDPKSRIAALARFLGVDLTTRQIEQMSESVSMPSSIGRHLEAGRSSVFSSEDLAAVGRYGFGVPDPPVDHEL